MRRLTLPALIVNSQYAELLVAGYPTASGARLYKTAECRGLRCETNYRGAVAIFCSASYQRSNEDEILWWLAHHLHRGKVSPAFDREVRTWCRLSYGYKYRLRGFVSIVDCHRADRLRDAADNGDRKAFKEWQRLAMAATDHRMAWQPAVYLETKPLYEVQTTPTYAPQLSPRFDAVCAGCQAAPPHNGAACHVNFQTVILPSECVPNIVQREVRQWPVQQSSKLRSAR